MAVRGGQYNVGPGSKAGSRGGRRNASTITTGNRTGGGRQQGRRGRRWRGSATTGGSANRGTQSSLQMGGGHTRRDSNRRQSGRHNMQEMSESQIVGFLGRKIWQSMNDEDGDISDDRKENFNYYIGSEYGNEREGYSKFVTREVLETVEWVLPSVLRVFLSGDKVVVFEPQNPDDEEAAEQETDITNYFVMRANNRGEGGFLSLHHWMKDALMYPNGYIKVWMEECTHTDVGTVTGLTEIGVAMLVEDPDTEILEQRSRFVRVSSTSIMPVQPPIGPAAPGVLPGGSPTQSPPPTTPPQGAAPATGRLGGQPDVNAPPMSGMEAMPPGVIPFPQPQEEEIEVFDLKIRTTKQIVKLRLDPVPPEEALVDNDTMSLNLDEADFVCHRVRKSYTKLINEGYDPDELDQVGLGEDYQWNDERVNRLFFEDEDPDAEDEDDPSMRTFWVHECYAWFDFDGDGIAEFRRVVLIGDRVFENVETNHQPLIALSSILMQHKHTGMSYIDIMKDLQILQSVLTRQLLDNIYRINNRRKFFSEDALTEDGSTMEAMLNIQSEFIPVRGNVQAAVAPEQTQSIVGELLPVIQHFTEQRATRTGVTPESQVDPNSLQEIRQDVFTNAIDRASQRIEMLVRIFAETGYRQLMLKVHQLLRSHWDIERTVKLRGKWVDVDPQGWRDRTDMYVNVGLGFHTKQQQLSMLAEMLNMQKEALPAGMSNEKKIYNALEKMVNAAGLGDARQYFTAPDDPDYVPPDPPQPDPQAVLYQAQAEGIKMEQQRKAQEFQVEARTEGQKAQMDMAIKRVELQTKNREMDLKERELALKERQMIADGQLKEGELQAKIDNIRADTENKKASADKTVTEAAQIAVELTDTYKEAVQIVSKAGEQNLPGSDAIEIGEIEDGDGERETETED